MVDDARHERFAEVLEVAPLDELTRRRLVTTALRATGSPRSRGRRLAAVASVLMVVALGSAALLVVRDPGGADRPTAAPAAGPDDRPAVLEEGDRAGSGDTGERSESSAAEPARGSSAVGGPPSVDSPVPDAGGFGDLSRAGARRRLLDALDPATFPNAGATATMGLGARLAGLSCSDELPPGTVVGAATGRFGDREAVVVVTLHPDGTRSVDAVVAAPCEVRRLG